MLNCIRRYRNDPNRTVVTFKMCEIMCLNKLSELNLAKEAVTERCCGSDAQDDISARKKECTCTSGEADCEEIINADSGSEQVEKRGTSKALEAQCECAGIGEPCSCASVPAAKIALKGGLNCEKTVRVLLCDLIGAAALGMGAIMLACGMKKLFK